MEVGAGWCGTAGITAYRMGAASVAITDGEEVMVECLGVNAAAAVGIRLGVSKISTSPRPNSVYPVVADDDGDGWGDTHRWSDSDPVQLNSPLTAHRLIWGRRDDANELFMTTGNGDNERCDLVVGCDCIHDANAVENLIVTIATHLNCSRVILCWESTWMRMEGEELFLRRMGEHGYKLRYYTASVLADLLLIRDDDIDRICEEMRSMHLESSDSELHLVAMEREGKSNVTCPPPPPDSMKK